MVIYMFLHWLAWLPECAASHVALAWFLKLLWLLRTGVAVFWAGTYNRRQTGHFGAHILHSFRSDVSQLQSPQERCGWGAYDLGALIWQFLGFWVWLPAWTRHPGSHRHLDSRFKSRAALMWSPLRKGRFAQFHRSDSSLLSQDQFSESTTKIWLGRLWLGTPDLTVPALCLLPSLVSGSGVGSPSWKSRGGLLIWKVQPFCRVLDHLTRPETRRNQNAEDHCSETEPVFWNACKITYRLQGRHWL